MIHGDLLPTPAKKTKLKHIDTVKLCLFLWFGWIFPSLGIFIFCRWSLVSMLQRPHQHDCRQHLAFRLHVKLHSWFMGLLLKFLLLCVHFTKCWVLWHFHQMYVVDWPYLAFITLTYLPTTPSLPSPTFPSWVFAKFYAWNKTHTIFARSTHFSEKWYDFVLFHDWVMFHCVYGAHVC